MSTENYEKNFKPVMLQLIRNDKITPPDFMGAYLTIYTWLRGLPGNQTDQPFSLVLWNKKVTALYDDKFLVWARQEIRQFYVVPLRKTAEIYGKRAFLEQLTEFWARFSEGLERSRFKTIFSHPALSALFVKGPAENFKKHLYLTFKLELLTEFGLDEALFEMDENIFESVPDQLSHIYLNCFRKFHSFDRL